MSRNKYEEQVIEKFEDIAKKYGKKPFKKQVKENRINLHVIVETESSGSISNLTKFWYCLATEKIIKPVVLLHIYELSTPNDYKSRLDMWEFLWKEIDESLNKGLKNKKDFKMLAKKYLLFKDNNADLNRALTDFEKCLKGEISHMF